MTDYWQSRRGRALAPLRADVDPCDFADLLPQVFILERLAAGRHVFRLCGEHLERLTGRALKNDDFANLWRGADRVGLQTAVEAALRRGAAIVVDARAEAEDGEGVDFEILLAPMVSASGQVDRLLGLCQAVSPLRPLRGRPIGPMRALHVRLAAPVEASASASALPHLKLAAVGGQRLS